MQKIESLFSKTFNIFKVFQIISLILISILVFLQVILREFLGIGIQWLFELSCFFQVTMVWLGIPILFYNNEHIQITALYSLFPDGVKKILNIVFYIIYVICIVMMAFGYIKYIQTLGFMKSPVMGMPNYIFFGSLSFGLLLSVLVLLFRFKEIVKV